MGVGPVREGGGVGDHRGCPLAGRAVLVRPAEQDHPRPPVGGEVRIAAEHTFDYTGRVKGWPGEGMAGVKGLQELAGKARPVALANERLLPVLDPLAPLLPGGGLRRGSVVSVASGSTSLALALLAGASAAGSWCAAVGL